jgi:Zn-dependent protease
MIVLLFLQNPLVGLILVVALIFSLVLHELGHGVVALWAGDDTALRAGRLTLNPLAHLDPLGVLLLLLVGIGWAKPVPIYPPYFRHYRSGLFFVSIAGIVVNLLLALFFALLLRALDAAAPQAVSEGIRDGSGGLLGVLGLALLLTASINVTLAVFNLLPIPPLDGSKILQSLLPTSFQPFLWQLQRYSFVSFLLLVTVLRAPVIDLISWVQRGFIQLVLG